MSNQEFLDKFFTGYWDKIDRSVTRTDSHSMFGDAEVFETLIRAVRPETIIEVGSWKGHSANFMADICRACGTPAKILCVDTFLGAVEHWLLPGAYETLNVANGRPTVFECFLGNTIARGNTDQLLPFPVDSSNAAKVLRAFDYRADLIFVDAAHGYEDVVADIESYLPLLSERGVMFGDDYQFEPLARAVHDMSVKHGFPVLVAQRKWMFLNGGLASSLLPQGFTHRKAWEGWVHP